ncbi:MAG TPA: c-type cytochrome, partial [Gemmatimonadales bacterium]|nr:c-type cytochrome [Gemmatimonadales bacterium]
SRVAVTGAYLKDGLAADSTGGNPVVRGRQLIVAGDCLSCHQVNRKSLGPMYVDVARRYHGDTTATARLMRKIREGGSGVWGKVAMAAHPALTDEQLRAMLAYIMSLAEPTAIPPALPVRGAYTPPSGSGDAPQGVVVLRALYTDRGGNGVPAITTEQMRVLRSPSVVVANGQMSDGVSQQSAEGVPVPIAVVNRSGASVALKQIDLTGVIAVSFMAVAPSQYQAKGGTIEVHRDSLTGTLLGTSERVVATTDQAPLKLHVVLAPTSGGGVHDVYFVFRNPEAKGDGFLFGVLTATFEAGP